MLKTQLSTTEEFYFLKGKILLLSITYMAVLFSVFEKVIHNWTNLRRPGNHADMYSQANYYIWRWFLCVGKLYQALKVADYLLLFPSSMEALLP